MFEFIGKIKLFNKVLKIVAELKKIKEANKQHADVICQGFDMVKQGAEIIVKELPFLAPVYAEIKELLTNAK